MLEMLEGQEAEMTPLDYDVPEAGLYKKWFFRHLLINQYSLILSEEMEEQPIESGKSSLVFLSTINLNLINLIPVVAVTEQGSMTESNVSPGLEAGE